MLVYTLGHTESYDTYLATEQYPSKLGRDKSYNTGLGYCGGSIWLTAEAAENYRKSADLEQFSVYSIEIQDMNDLELNGGKEFYDLLVNSLIIEKVTF